MGVLPFHRAGMCARLSNATLELSSSLIVRTVELGFIWASELQVARQLDSGQPSPFVGQDHGTLATIKSGSCAKLANFHASEPSLLCVYGQILVTPP
ncbi:hypothetical protein GALL_485700 [mine drainage metagenome]|uniref:Uncharacterized protein n=1 Tax=mine drainage metagenome TaxID=410659 RepID=A0A1J5PWY9_9ZZZZ